MENQANIYAPPDVNVGFYFYGPLLYFFTRPISDGHLTGK